MIWVIDADPALLTAVLAGWVSGFAVALASTGLVMLGLSRMRFRPLPGLHVSLPILGIVAVNAFVIAWTLVGIGAGVAFYAAGPRPFAVGMGAVHLLAGLIYLVARGRLWSGEARIVWATLAASLGAFLALLPFLAARG